MDGTPVASGAASGPITLVAGANTISIEVTAADTVTTKTYTVVVTKAAANADLSSLTVSTGTLTPVFAVDTTFYAVSVGSLQASITVTPTAADAVATITVNGTAVASGAASAPVLLSSTVTAITVVVTASDGLTTKTYSIDVIKTAYLKASTSEAIDWFGLSVAISGDTIVVGAGGEDSNAIGVNGNEADNSTATAGAVYVFTRTAGVWSQQAYLKASNTGGMDQFGRLVAISGDTIVVGAPGESSNATGVNGNETDNSAANAGAAYVFTRTANVWSQQAYLKASNTAASDFLGWSVSISNDTIVVGAYGEDSNATGVNGDQSNNLASTSGAAYVFTRTANVWSQQAYLKASNTDALDFFGYSLSVSGDTIVVGAFNEDSNATGVNGNEADNSASSAGAAYVFSRTANVWSQQAYLKASNTESPDNFGITVSVSGDTIVAGATGEDSNATGVNGTEANNSATLAGGAYVFTRTANVWSQQAYLKASNTESMDDFGAWVFISGDAILVGADYEDSNATGVNGNEADNSAVNSGAVYYYTRTMGVWGQQAYLKASNTEAGDYFGLAGSISNGTIVIGAYSEDSNATGVNGDQTDNSATSSGAAYVY